MKAWNLLLLIIFIFLSSCTQHHQLTAVQLPKEENQKIHKGHLPRMNIVYTDYGAAAYAKKYNQRYLQIIETIKLNRVDLLYTCHVKHESDVKIVCNSDDSPRLQVLRKLIREYKSNGLYVSLRVYVDLENQKWRAFWRPKPLSQGFKNLEKLLVSMAKVASTLKVDQLFLGSEYEMLTLKENHPYWSEIIKKVRKVFNGRILYAANGNRNHRKVKEYQWVPFWRELDAVGINHYPGYKGEFNYNSIYEHHDYILKKLTQFAQKFSKPLIISEIGFPMAATGLRTPYQWDYKKEVGNDQYLQLMSMKAFFYAARANGVDEFYLWRYLPKEKEIHPQGYIIDNPPTINLLRSLNGN